jgi:glutamate carboxypeptidase
MNDISQQVERLLPEGLRFLERMVHLESPSYDPHLVDALGDAVADEFERLGGDVERLPESDRGHHLMIRFGHRASSGVQPIMLLGHLDTVWPAGEIGKRPFRIEGDTATGPGVFDMKAGIAMMHMAVKSLQIARGELPAPLAVFLTSNEEVGSPNVRQLVRDVARSVRCALVLEPSLPGGALKTTRNGMGRFVVRAIGRSAHSGVDPGAGVNAIEEIAHQVMRISKLGDRSKGTTVTVTTAKGGTRPNMVPAECVVEADCRTPTAEEAERVTREIRNLKPVLDGARIEVEGEFRRPPLEPTPRNTVLFEEARAVARSLGREIQGGSTGGASDGNLTSGEGTPTLDGLGPIGHGAHQADESIEVSSLAWRTSLVAGLIARIPDLEFPPPRSTGGSNASAR